MTGLIKNEVIKIFCRRLTMFLLLFICVFSIGSSFVYKASNKSTEDWKTRAQETVQLNQNRIDLVELSPQLKSDAENKLAIATYRLENNIPEPEPNALSAILNTSGLIEIIIFIVLIVAAEIVSREYNDGTMKLLLIRPHSRTKILVSKYISIVFLGIVALFLMLLCAGITNIFLYGLPDIHTTDLFINQQGNIVNLSVLSQIIKLYVTSIFPILSYATIAFTISTILKNSAFAVGVSLVLMLCGNMMIESTSKIAWMKFLPFANSDMSLYIYHLQPRPEMTIGFSISVLVAYMLFMFIISVIIFKKRDVSI